MRLVLASASPSRLRLLRIAGIEPEVRVSDVDEAALAAAAGPSSPADYVQLLATAKARAVAARISADPDAAASKEETNAQRTAAPSPPATLVLGCDSAFEFEGVVSGKPHRPEVAAERWRAMRGRTGTLHTGHTLIDLTTGRERHAVRSTTLDFAAVSDAEIEWYVASGEPLPVAGAFTLDGLASAFITRIDGDPHAVVGLSIAALRELVLDLGHDWTALADAGRAALGHPYAAADSD